MDSIARAWNAQEVLSEARSAVAGEPRPCALIDLDAFEANAATVLKAAQQKPVRVATKSVRCVALLRRLVKLPGVRGLMTYSARETAWLASLGFDDLLLAYPTLRDASLLAQSGAAVTADSPAHLAALSAGYAGRRIPVVLDVDMSFRVGPAHLGVRRSPLRTLPEVAALAASVRADPHLEFRGLLAYEAQIAGTGDTPALRALKALSRPEVARRRKDLADALRPELFNGGGTGSLDSSSAEEALTEVAAGSGFFKPHLFDHLTWLRPAAFFALEVTRTPAPGIFTCQGGGFIASGEAGPSRLPRPAEPDLELLSFEGAGEVQTPLRGARKPGDTVLFRHAKAGELCEHFNELLLVRGGRVEARAKTYRGEGHAF